MTVVDKDGDICSKYFMVKEAETEAEALNTEAAKLLMLQWADQQQEQDT